MSVTTRRTFTALFAAGALTLTLGACSSSGGSSSGSSSAPAAATSSAAMSSPTASTAMADAPFGAACAAVPKDGAGSFTGMAKDPVA
ncbi:fasciclin domain-containing protein, partial [Kitasatospora cineracea]